MSLHFSRVSKLAHSGAARQHPVRVLNLLIRTVLEKSRTACGLTMPPRTSELLFQERQLAGIGEFSDRMALLLCPSTQQQMFPEDLLAFFRDRADEIAPRKLLVADVGAGLVSFLSWGHNQGLFELIAIDVLADEYRRLLKLYGREDALGNMRLVQSAAEDLTAVGQLGLCDIVYSANALDHTASPRKAIEQMVAIARPCGHVIITGNSREGTREGWNPIHQHDLFLEQRALWRSGRDGQRSLLTEGLPLSVVYANDPQGLHGRMVVIFRKDGGGEGAGDRPEG